MITLWGRTSSINVQKVLWTLDEIGLAYESNEVGGDAGGLDSAAFRALNPHGRIPVLQDDGVALWESNAIVRYLCARYAQDVLCPRDPLARSASEGWMDWTLATLQPAIMGLFWSWYRTPETLRDGARNAELSEARDLAILTLEGWLTDRPYLAGGALTMADVPAGALMHRYAHMGLPLKTTPAAFR